MIIGASSFLLLGLFLAGTIPADDEGRILRGTVTDSTGRVLSGATVFACPVAFRAGLGTACEYIQGRVENSTDHYCPTCQSDRGQRVLTSDDGSFEIAAPEPERGHFLVAVKAGYMPAWKGEKEDGGRPRLVLSRLTAERLEPARMHLGRVLDPAGEPVVDASVRCVGIDSPGGRRWMSSGADRMAITGAEGVFLLTSEEPDAPLFVRVRANGCATRTAVLPAGETPTTIRLERGVSVEGRLLDGERGLAGVRVGLVPHERAPDVFLGDMTCVTDDEGRFRFDHVATGHAYHLFGKMGELADGRVVGLRRVELAEGAGPVDVGRLEPGATHRLSGRVVVAGGAPPPEGTMLLVMRREAWDSRAFPVQDDGAFEATGLPAEPLIVSVRTPDHRLSARNPSLDPDDRFGVYLTGRLLGDREGFVIHLTPDDEVPVDDAGGGELAPRSTHPADLPLRSAILEGG